ncbi:transcriptional regulator, partial [Enterococcus faecium]
MAKNRIEEKPDLTVTGIGVELKSRNTHFVGLAAEKQAS